MQNLLTLDLLLSDGRASQNAKRKVQKAKVRTTSLDNGSLSAALHFAFCILTFDLFVSEAARVPKVWIYYLPFTIHYLLFIIHNWLVELDYEIH
jgi:hypothetical protein